MDLENIVNILFIILLVITMSSITIAWIFNSIEDRDKIKQCETLKGTCDYYSCMSEKRMTHDEQRNYLMKQQNCILENMSK